ncbi:DUF971 domain-containing protein [bacterium]|jgi:DUF971 family protein|nr:DUF971 domain-containing protein [bacterium]
MTDAQDPKAAQKIPVFPTRIDSAEGGRMLMTWNSGETYTIAFTELRFQCPCASCVDEHSGQRTIKKEDVDADVRPIEVGLMGRYAVHIAWSDKHSTGMYHFDRLYELCRSVGKLHTPEVLKTS